LCQFAFWLCVAASTAPYVVYPLVVWWLARRHHPHASAQSPADVPLPSVTMVVCTHNEQAVINTKLTNAFELDYPRDRFDVLLISDASTDQSAEIAERFPSPAVTVVRLANRVGKSRALSLYVPQTRGDVTLFTDANAMFDPHALKRLVGHLGDPAVGFAIGHQVYEPGGPSAARLEGRYADFEASLKSGESRIGSVVGGDGAIMIVRRSDWMPVADDEAPDFALPLRLVAAGKRGVFEPAAVCVERAAATYAEQFERKVRIVNRAMRSVLRTPAVLRPDRTGWFALQVWLHKMLRWLAPFFLLGMVVFAALSVAAGARWYAGILLAQMLGFGVALLGLLPLFRRVRAVQAAWYFCVVNAAAGWGVLGVCLGRRYTFWQPRRADRPRD
jgi:cellulose synthase/poly-beta-1,6-N-acetylglucosamine synthase-like glycosyltransferase